MFPCNVEARQSLITAANVIAACAASSSLAWTWTPSARTGSCGLWRLGAQYLALAEKQGATVPLMIGQSRAGNVLAVVGIRRQRTMRSRIVKRECLIVVLSASRDVSRNYKGGFGRPFPSLA